MDIPQTILGHSFSTDLFSPSFESFPDSMRQNPIAEEITSLCHTPAGWDYGAGVAIENNVIHTALEIYNSTFWMGFKVQVFPRSDGGITLSYSVEDNFLDVIINPDLTLSLVQEKGVGEEYEVILEEQDTNPGRVKAILNSIMSSACPSLELYTNGNTILKNSVSKVIASPPWEVGYLFSMPTAQDENQEQYASIYGNSIRQQLVAR